MQKRWLLICCSAILLGIVACNAAGGEAAALPEFLSGGSDEAEDEEPRITDDSPISAEPVINAQGQLEQWANTASATSEFTPDGWSARQATGVPNVFGCGDDSFAWASAQSDGIDSITLRFPDPVIPQRIDIYETYNPGAISSITVTTENAEVIEVFSSLPQTTTECPRLLRVPVNDVDQFVDTVTINLDQTNHPSWNEIDAVQLIGLPEGS